MADLPKMVAFMKTKLYNCFSTATMQYTDSSNVPPIFIEFLSL